MKASLWQAMTRFEKAVYYPVVFAWTFFTINLMTSPKNGLNLVAIMSLVATCVLWSLPFFKKGLLANAFRLLLILTAIFLICYFIVALIANFGFPGILGS